MKKKKNIGRIVNGILGLLFPPVCVHCRKMLDFRSTDALCTECKKLWGSELISVCRDCYMPVEKCECTPAGASKNLKKLFHAVEYDPEVESVSRSVILSAKNGEQKFLNELISSTLENTLKTHMPRRKNLVITYLPRSSKNVDKTGVDQALTAAKELSKRTGIPFVSAVTRTGGKEQKRLNMEQRKENAYSSYAVNAKAIPEVAKKTVVICDDVVTTGASMSAAADIIRTMGASTVIGLSLGRAYKKAPKNKE